MDWETDLYVTSLQSPGSSSEQREGDKPEVIGNKSKKELGS